MAVRKPLVVIAGVVKELPSGDTLPSAPPPDAFEVDGGVAATDYIGTLQIDFGGAS